MKSRGPDARYAGVKFRGNKLLRSDGGKRASAHRGERVINRKAIAQGMSDCLRCPVCSCAQLLLHCARDLGCSVHPAFPAPSDYRGRELDANFGRIAPRECETVSAVIASHRARIRAPVARNDEVRPDETPPFAPLFPLCTISHPPKTLYGAARSVIGEW